MKLLVCGGRDYADTWKVFDTLDFIHNRTPITLLIHGAAKGADSIASDWALSRGVPTEAHPADWARMGREAGPWRNLQMLARDPDLVVAFPGGRGTAHMVRIVKGKGKEVREIE